MSAPPARAAAQPPAPRPAPTGQAAARPAPGRQAPGRQSPKVEPKRRLRTPTALRLVMTLSIVASLLAGAGGLAIGLWQSASLDSVSERTSEVVSLLEAQADLATADATVTNAFLIGGQEPSELRVEFQDALGSGTAAIAALAGSRDDADGLLAAVAADLVTYSGLVEQARAANRQGFPVGAAYLDQGSTLLETAILPDIDSVVVATADGAARDLNRVGGAYVISLLLIVPLAVLLVAQIWLARRTRRTFNVPFFVGSVVLALAVVVSISAFNTSRTDTAQVRDGSYTSTLALSQALSHSGQARSDEAFTLIRRGSGAAYEQQFQNNVTQARGFLDRYQERSGIAASPLHGAFDIWIGKHAEVRALDDGGDWDAAVALATSREQGSPSAAYLDFVAVADETVAGLAEETRTAFGQASTRPVLVGWITAAAGVACAVLAWRGLARRLEEYR